MKQIAADSDLVLVVGSTNSSNSVRLVEVALDAGARASYLVDDVSHIDAAWLDGVTTVGVTSGASVPESLVADVLAWLAEQGYGEVKEVTAAEERLDSHFRTSCVDPTRLEAATSSTELQALPERLGVSEHAEPAGRHAYLPAAGTSWTTTTV